MGLQQLKFGQHLLMVVVVSFMVLAVVPRVYGQGFMVRPMVMEFTARPGQTVETELELTNTMADASTLLIQPHLLTQSGGGAWRAIDPKDQAVDSSQLRSCCDWIGLSAEEIELAPLETKTVLVSLKVPHGVRGFYGAALIVRSKPESEEGIALVIRFLITLRVTIEGPPTRERIELTNVGMQHVEATEHRSATTVVSVEVNNTGETYGRLGGTVTVLRQAGTHWQRVADVKIPERGIIPGAALILAEDLNRRLPSGRYKLQGTMRVGGRARAPVTKEIEFQGDPTVTTVAADVPLMLEPETVTIEAVPGSSRSGMLTLQNPSGETLKVTCAVVACPGLRGVALGSLTGDDFSCAQWTRVSPETLTLRGGGQRNIRVTVQFPNIDNAQPNCYADLHLQASYPDGQNAGDTQTLIQVRNPKVEAKANAQPTSLTIAQQEEDKYVVSAQFANVGNVDFTPTAVAVVATPTGNVAARTPLETSAGRVLPLGSPQFSGVIDFAKVEPGLYLLTATMSYAGQHVSSKLPIRVETEEGRKKITVIEAAPEPQETTATPPETSDDQE